MLSHVESQHELIDFLNIFLVAGLNTQQFSYNSPKMIDSGTFFTRSLRANSIWCARRGMGHTAGSFLSTLYKVQPFSFNHVCDTDQICSSMKPLLLPLSLNALQSKMMAFLGLFLLFPEKSRKQVSTRPVTTNSVQQFSLTDKLSTTAAS